MAEILPKDLTLPFFDYGIFKPGELAFLNIKEFIREYTKGDSVKGSLQIVNGIPILNINDYGAVIGDIIYFKQGNEENAYRRISECGIQDYFKWELIETSTKASCNCLTCIKPQKDRPIWYDQEWLGKDDPYFTTGFQVINETILEAKNSNDEERTLFKLGMAYLLLWSTIERFSSLRYGPGFKPHDKIKMIANDQIFSDGLLKYVNDTRYVYRAERIKDKEKLIRDNPKRSIEYYYQIRSNLTHMGKGASHDYEIIEKSLKELKSIIEDIIKISFQEASMQVSSHPTVHERPTEEKKPP